MRRADRLFQIIQILRRSGRPTTAAAMAAELETSQRTVYRDIAALMAQRVPIRGEAGTGYVLERGFDLPPLMLTLAEVEAAVLGAQWVAERGDPDLARAAHDLVAKLGTILPDRLKPLVFESATAVSPIRQRPPDIVDHTKLRAWCRAGRKLALRYEDPGGQATERTVWPFMVGYNEGTRVTVAWCELRSGFRMFRTDRIRQLVFLDLRYPARPAALRAQWRAEMATRRAEAGAGDLAT